MLPNKSKQEGIFLMLSIIIVMYSIITVITPSFGALDSNGPKFFSLALLNLIVFTTLLILKKTDGFGNEKSGFFSNAIGLAYLCFMLLAILSVVKAGNIPEWIVTISKFFTIFFAAMILSLILKYDKRLVVILSLAMTVLLIYDSAGVIFGLSKYITGQLTSIYQINGGYSNKNILAASVFIKIPFAIWLLLYQKTWKRYVGLLALLMAFFSVLVLSSRTFYLGIIILLALFIGFIVLQFFIKKNKMALKPMIWIGGVVVAFGIFTVTQQILYPKTNATTDVYNNNFFSRLTTLKGEAGGIRIDSWKRSMNLIKENPMLGVGVGNWKVAVLKYANLKNPDYIYHQKNHNDFIEFSCETGILGGIFYLLIYILIIYRFILVYFNRESTENEYKYLMLAALGIVCYSIDAFFNFPADRPETALLFSIFVAIGVAYSSPVLPKQNRWHSALNKLGLTINKHSKILIILLMISSAVFLYMNFQSLKIQQIAMSESDNGNFKHNATYFINEFPSIPSISLIGEPVAVNIARVLINEKKYAQAIHFLREDYSSPYDMRKEYFTALCYYYMENRDSVDYYSQLVFKQKPLFYNNIELMCWVQERSGKKQESVSILKNYLQKITANSLPWLKLSNLYFESGEKQLAISVLDSALALFPTDTMFQNRRKLFMRQIAINANDYIYKKGIKFYNEKKYQEAIKYFTEFIEKVPDWYLPVEYRAYSFAAIKDFQQSENDLNYLIKIGIVKPSYYNLKGVICYNLRKNDAACINFKKASEMGDKEGIMNYKNLCKAMD